MHRITVKKTRACEPSKVLTVRVTSEYEAGGFEPNWLVRVGIDRGLLRGLVKGKAEGLTGHLRDQGLSQAEAGFNVDLIFFTVGRICGVHDIGVFSGNDLLD